MLNPKHKALVLLLMALSSLAGASPVLALDDAKPPKPLNLLAFARRATAARKAHAQAMPPPTDHPVRAAVWAAEDTAASITGAVPAPENPPPSPPPAKTGGDTPPPKSALSKSAVPKSAVPKSAPPKPAPPAASPASNDVDEFCSNVANSAVDARLAWQLKELEKAENLLRERIAEVEAKRAEYEKWMSLRDEFLKKAEASVVEIYSRMKPDAAATQIAGMADETAAAVLAKLSPRNASAIFDEMDPARAAHLADLLGGMRRTDDGKSSQ